MIGRYALPAFRTRSWMIATVLALTLATLASGQAVTQDTGRTPEPTPFGPAVSVVWGYVTTVDSQPIAGATVEAYLRSNFRSAYTVTDSQGYYSLSIPQHSDFWEIRVHAPGYYSASEQVAVWIDRQRQDFTLHLNRRIKEHSDDQMVGHTESKARKLMMEGLIAAKHGKSEQAVKLLREAIETDPSLTPALTNLGVQLQLAGKSQEAEQMLRRAVAQDPADYSARFNLGILLFQASRYSEAEPVFKEAALIDPTSPMAKLYLGRSALALGLGKTALENLQSAEKLGKGKLDVSLELSDALLMTGQRDKAIAKKKEWLSKHAKDPRAAHVRQTLATLEQSTQAPNSGR